MSVATIHIDGAARGNPGPAAFAFVIQSPEHGLIEESKTLGEYRVKSAELKQLYEEARQLARHFRQVSGISLR